MVQKERKIKAWILDAQVHKNGIMLWMVTENGTSFRALHRYQPSFYVVFSDDADHFSWSKKYEDSSFINKFEERYQKIQNSISEHHEIVDSNIQYRRVHAEDIQSRPVLRIRTASPFSVKRVVRDLKNLQLFTFYNTDLPIAQMFFYETGLFPFAFCEIKLKFKAQNHNQDCPIISDICLLDSNETIEYDFPPLKVIWLDLEFNTKSIHQSKTDSIKKCIITEDPCSSPLHLSELFHPSFLRKVSNRDEEKGYNQEVLTRDKIKEANQIVIEEGREIENLRMLEKSIKRIDPDIIFTQHGDEYLFPYLEARISYHHIDNEFTLSRDKTPLKYTRFQVGKNNNYMSYGVIHHKSDDQYYLNGRLHIDSAVYGGLHFENGNLYGIVEVARVSYVTLQRLTRITIGGALQSLQFYHAYKQNILVPEEKRNSEFFREGYNLLLSDRGGHIMQPQVGMFKRVAELDFTSMYPSLMVKYNVSPETLNCPCCKREGIQVPGLNYHICIKREGIVPLSINLPLVKRIQYKKRAKNLEEKGTSDALKEASRFLKMEGALKWILVVCFGYLGFRNARFGRIEAHQAVCAYSREFLINAMNVIEKNGLKAIHGIVDSLYVQAPEEMQLDVFHRKCVKSSQEISQVTKIPISYSPHSEYYEVIAFLPTKATPRIGALNRYWGIKKSGGVKVRGVELRRHDSPPFIKDFQLQAINQIGALMNNAPIYHLKGEDFDIHGVMEFFDGAIEHNYSDFNKIIAQNGWREYVISGLIPLIREYFSQLEGNKLKKSQLAITIRITRTPEQYKVNNYQKIAAAILKRFGLKIYPGKKISYIITDDQSENAFNRVVPMQLYNEKHHFYDVNKYKELLVRALTNLFPFPVNELIKRKMQKLQSASISSKKRTKYFVQKSLI